MGEIIIDGRPVCFHRDAEDFRDESATVRIGKCPDCGEDTEWEWGPASVPIPEYAEGYATALAAVRERVEGLLAEPGWYGRRYGYRDVLALLDELEKK